MYISIIYYGKEETLHMIYETAYETLAAKYTDVSDIKEDLLYGLSTGNLIQHERNKYLLYANSFSSQVKPFAHPIVIDNNIFIDTRMLTKFDKMSNSIAINKEFTSVVINATFTIDYWLNGGTEEILLADTYHVNLFARLFSLNLGMRLNLDQRAVSMLEIITGWFYTSLFYQDTSSQEYKVKAARIISRATRYPMETVMEMSAENYDKGIESFVEHIKQLDVSRRLENLTPALIYTMLGGIWFGPNANQVMAVALEHPPTWLSLVYMSVIDKSYRSTILKTLGDKIDPRNEDRKVFIDTYSRYLRTARENNDSVG